MAQCDVRIYSKTNSICVGDTISMSAKGGCGIAFFADFNDSTFQNIQSNNNPAIGSVCSPSLDNTYHLWLGNTAGQNLIYTPAMNTVAGGYLIYFDMIYGKDGVGGLCDGPSTVAESVHLQYSINNGVSWVNLQSWDPNGGSDPNLINWKNYVVILPPAANTANTMFRWTQLSILPANTACWGIDNIKIQRYVPTQFLWSTSYSGDTHPDISPNNTTTYWVTASSGATSSVDSITITVFPRPTSTFTTSRPLCKNMLIDLIYNGNADSTASFHWSISNALQVIDTNKINAKALWSKTGQYAVSLTVANQNCVSFPTKEELLIEPLISFYISSSQGCVPLEVSYTGNVQPATSNYIWDFKDGGISTLQDPTHIYQTAGNYGLTLIALTDSGCSDTASFPILTKVYPSPIVNFSHSPEIVPWSNPEATFSNLTTGASNYEWYFGDPNSGNNNSNSINPNHIFSEKGVFDVQLIATSDKGCIDSITKQIRVADDEFRMPNIITPNGDGFNEYLKISNLESLKECKIEIFNRWGKLVFQSDNYQNNWNAMEESDGVYYYTVSYISWFGPGELHGFFHVMRKNQ